MKKPYKFGLIGHNISYSKSGEVFETIFKQLNLKGEFIVYSTDPGLFKNQLINFRSNGTRGFSVTIPYKNEIIDHLDDIDPIANALKAVNCVVVDEGRLLGFNTDCYGFPIPLRPHASMLKHGRAIIIGCGGAAAAVVYSLYLDFEIKNFTVLGRTDKNLNNFQQLMENRFRKINIVTESSLIPEQTDKKYDIMVNCTPLGGWNHSEQSPIRENINWRMTKIYYDLNYNDDNKIIKSAAEAGIITINGSSMLVGQAIRAFDIWTGKIIPFEPVYEKVFKN
ncbi:MAG: shikimate dehydrogenase family protein [Candidatus Zixiibacteriota bacterium]